jgi:PAS domain S-box-containing protein
MGDYIKFKRLIESLENEYFFYSHTLDGKYVYISPSVEKVLGYTVEEAFGGLVKYMTDSELNRQTIETLKKSASGEKQNTFELELYTKNREIKVVEITESPQYDDDGKLLVVEGVAHDITKRKENERIIQEQNDQLKKQKQELESTLVHLNETQGQLIQSEKMRALGHLIAGIAHEINTPIGAINASVENISTSIEASKQNLFRLMTQFTKNELLIFLQIMAMIEKGSPVMTSKIKREYKKEISDKLAGAGFENVTSLADLIMYLNLYNETDKVIQLLQTREPEYILKSLKDIYSIRKNAENIKLAVSKASTVIFALKKFSHKEQQGIKESADIIESIETVLTLLHNSLKQGVEVVKEYDKIPFVDCYADELIQVWINLISNSIHAMNNKGTITITVKNLGDRISVGITDTGSGIPDEIKSKIFEPFYTTKKAGEGTGLGLDIVQQIVEKHGAEIHLESKVGEGTTITIVLPVN